MRKLMLMLLVLMMVFSTSWVFAQRIVGLAPGCTDPIIQLAVNNSAPGGTIDIDPSYNPALEVFPVGVFIPNLTIQGRFGGEAVIGNGSDKIFVMLANGCTIQNLVFANAGGGDGLWFTVFGFAGAICNWGVSNTTISNCQFLANVGGGTISDGAGIYIQTGSSNIVIYLCQFYDNIATWNGGGVAAFDSNNILISKCTFGGNIAVNSSGGAIYVENCTGIPVYPYDVHIELSDFFYNLSGWDGGAISWWLSDGVIDQNTIGVSGSNSTEYGGGIAIGNCATTPALTIISQNDIFFNTAVGTTPCPWSGGHGGGIFIENSDDTVQVATNNNISTNTATFFGGGIAVNAYWAPCYPLIIDNTITTNTVTNQCDGGLPNGGGGISVRYEPAPQLFHPLIQYNTIDGNQVLGGFCFGGGIGCFSSAPAIETNDIFGNVALDYGGGIGLVYAYDQPNQGSIIDNLIVHNYADQSGGGVYMRNSGPLFFDRNNVDSNLAGAGFGIGGGMYTWDSAITVRSCNFTRNQAVMTTGTAVCVDVGNTLNFYNNTVADNNMIVPDGDAMALASPADLQNNIFSNHPNLFAIREYFVDWAVPCTNNLFWNNAGVYDDFLLGPRDVTQLNAMAGNTGNIAGDPLLDPTYHLSTNLSAAYDAGVDLTAQGVTFDIDNEARPYGPIFDIGSDELYVTPTPTPTPTPTATPTATATPTGTPTATPTATPTGLVPTPVQTWTFEPPPEGWTYHTASPPAGIPAWSHCTSVQVTGPPGAIGTTAATLETTDYYGSWDCYSGNPSVPAINWAANSVWRAIFTMTSNKSDPNTVPSIRLRFVENQMKATSYIQLYPGSWVPLAQRGFGTTDYKLYLRPPVTDVGFFLAFDIVDFGAPYGVACNGTVYLEEVNVERFDIAESGGIDYSWANVRTYSGTGLHTWSHSSAGVAYLTDVNGYSQPTAGLEQNTMLAQTRAFGAWTSPAEVDIVTTPQLYRVEWTLACENSTQVASIRMRMHTDDFRYASYMAIDRALIAAESALPPSTGKDYYIYADFPGTPTAGYQLLAWDLYDFDPAAGGWGRLTEVDVERRDLP